MQPQLCDKRPSMQQYSRHGAPRAMAHPPPLPPPARNCSRLYLPLCAHLQIACCVKDQVPQGTEAQVWSQRALLPPRRASRYAWLAAVGTQRSLPLLERPAPFQLRILPAYVGGASTLATPSSPISWCYNPPTYLPAALVCCLRTLRTRRTICLHPARPLWGSQHAGNGG